MLWGAVFDMFRQVFVTGRISKMGPHALSASRHDLRIRPFCKHENSALCFFTAYAFRLLECLVKKIEGRQGAFPDKRLHKARMLKKPLLQRKTCAIHHCGRLRIFLAKNKLSDPPEFTAIGAVRK
jgi:hypothetical protein